MTFWFLNQLKKLVAILNSNISPNQIAAGFALGILIGLMPFNILVSPVLIACLFIFQVNSAMGFWAMVFAQILAYLVDPVANYLGHYLLVNMPVLTPLWTKLYNAPIWPYTHFNNTMMLGSLVAGILLLLPMFILARVFVIQWRLRIKSRVDKWKIVQMVKASKPVELWTRFRNIKDAL